MGYGPWGRKESDTTEHMMDGYKDKKQTFLEHRQDPGPGGGPTPCALRQPPGSPAILSVFLADGQALGNTGGCHLS